MFNPHPRKKALKIGCTLMAISRTRLENLSNYLISPLSLEFIEAVEYAKVSQIEGPLRPRRIWVPFDDLFMIPKKNWHCRHKAEAHFKDRGPTIDPPCWIAQQCRLCESPPIVLWASRSPPSEAEFVEVRGFVTRIVHKSRRSSTEVSLYLNFEQWRIR